ncbi:glutathione synthase [Hypoxylon rubiginosum]|uniref:Glutathione synthase n=1 Tax=Hypoxylon rubiginosum TaxID=110542 RepID=A0ACC0D560_9PEZI|nr:glutathione synthase [Hypoxylon rubiginosum]
MEVPIIDEDHAERVLSELEDYQISHGSLLKVPRGLVDFESPTALARPVGVSIVPTIFPQPQFEQAQYIQRLFNELYIKVSEDDAWLETITRPLARVDEFVAKLWSIWERVRDEGEVQKLRCGIFRSDYMLHCSDLRNLDRGATSDEDIRKDLIGSKLKQVEFNTYSCAGGSHATMVANMHRYLAQKGTHEATNLPANNALRSIVEVLAKAHHAYVPTSGTRKRAILMTVQPNNVNICDERPIEYALSECDPPIILYRVEFSDEVMQSCSLGPDRELLFRPPSRSQPLEISVVYQRAGYDSHEYDEQGVGARLMLEKSRAIKCPTILSHIAGLKKVQQELTRPGALERFLDPEGASILRPTFAPQFPVDESEDGRNALRIASDREAAENYVLKPSLEGGGHNIFGRDIPDFLEAIPPQEKNKYILMEKIRPPMSHGILVSPMMIFQGPVISELGILGACIWRRDGQNAEIITNSRGGWTFKTKPHDVEEMSVVKGYGCFDCPSLF